jgi:hypothetical protein
LEDLAEIERGLAELVEWLREVRGEVEKEQ